MSNDLLNKGRHSLAAGEWEKAHELLEKAVKREESAEAYEELAWACWWLNNASGVFENRSKAYNLYLEKNEKLGASRSASWMGLDYIEFKGEFAVASGWFKRAESLLKGLPDSPELGFIKLLKARWAFQAEKNNELAFKLIDESSELGKSLNSIDVEMLAEALKGFILVIEGKISEGMPLLDEATLLATTREDGDIKYTTITCCYLIDACERVRDYERASQWCNNVKELCKRWRYKAMFANCKMKYAGVLIRKGDWQEAEEELLSASSDLQTFRPIQVNACTVRLADLKRRQGKWDEAEKLLGEAGTHPLKQLYSSELCYDKGDYENALNTAERYLRGFSPKEKAERTTGVELLLRIHIKLGNLQQAKDLLNELKDIAQSINTLPLKAAMLSAEGELNSALKNFDRLKLPFEASRSRITLSEILRQLNKFAQAEAELNTAMTELKELGAEKDFEKAKNLLKNLSKDKAYETGKDLQEFTGRELEVLRLIAQGKNNEEIAEKLFLSVRTVEKHLTNIYSKMGVSGKSASAYAASYAIKQKLVLT
jgi:ATP/maltotriose-dependent transcriptional regulator MalT